MEKSEWHRRREDTSESAAERNNRHKKGNGAIGKVGV